ncbi:MAG: hypothetical protein KY468_20790 [Armatimonadetes bacterium]|nr:hypothetical protein [Armatimonadota bacterium]
MKELTPEVKQTLLAPFQAAEVRMRTYPYVAAYVTARVVMTRLDEALPWQWSFKLAGPGMVDSNGVMHQDGVLIIHHPNGQTMEFHDRGSAPPDAGKGQSKQAKHAVSDCFKRCAVHVGVGRYLYELQGVQGGLIPKPALEKSLAAVGYHGPWDDRHHGKIGGIREADLEDEPEDAGVSQSPPEASRQETARHEAPEAPRAARPVEKTVEKARTEPEIGDTPPAPNGKAAKSSRRSSAVKLDDEQRAQIEAAVDMSGGNVQSPTFLGWLSKNTANHATSLDEILSEDVDVLIDKLEQLATKRSHRSSNGK